MRTYSDLNESEQKLAVSICLANIVETIIDGTLVPNRELSMKIESIILKAEKGSTPWFAGEMILDDKQIARELSKLALVDAMSSLYPNPDEDIPNYIRL